MSTTALKARARTISRSVPTITTLPASVGTDSSAGAQGNFTTALKAKLDAVEALADVTDTANVVAALTGGTNVNLASRRNDLIGKYYLRSVGDGGANSKQLHDRA